MKNIPNEIWLQVGEETPADADFKELGEVTWCSEKIEDNAIHYVNADSLVDKIEKIAKIVEYSEGESEMVTVLVQLDELKNMVKGESK